MLREYKARGGTHLQQGLLERQRGLCTGKWCTKFIIVSYQKRQIRPFKHLNRKYYSGVKSWKGFIRRVGTEKSTCKVRIFSSSGDYQLELVDK